MKEPPQMKIPPSPSGNVHALLQGPAQKSKWEAYRGKLALLQTYEMLGIHNKYTDALRREVKRRMQYLHNQGEL